MSRYNPLPSPAPERSERPAPPASCPSCQSTLIVTTAKSPDADSYWRCTKCGEVWNAARMHTDTYGSHRWR